VLSVLNVQLLSAVEVLKLLLLRAGTWNVECICTGPVVVMSQSSSSLLCVEDDGAERCCWAAVVDAAGAGAVMDCNPNVREVRNETDAALRLARLLFSSSTVAVAATSLLRVARRLPLSLRDLPVGVFLRLRLE